eukprot:GILK01007789.1.p1 GENE.GILK01007789.1~~GILK01007789.1.p1  ORF type:complete len:154 (-),score=24.92 GILK01007789.1:197-658(-)
MGSSSSKSKEEVPKLGQPSKKKMITDPQEIAEAHAKLRAMEPIIADYHKQLVDCWREKQTRYLFPALGAGVAVALYGTFRNKNWALWPVVIASAVGTIADVTEQGKRCLPYMKLYTDNYEKARVIMDVVPRPEDPDDSDSIFKSDEELKLRKK